MRIAVIAGVEPVFTVAVDDFIVRTTVTSNGYVVERWIDEILRIHHSRLHQLIIGLDVEWRRPTYSRSQNPAAVLQICVGVHCLVFQVRLALYFPPNLRAFLGDDRFKFVGIWIQNDADLIEDNCNLHVANIVDLRFLAVEKMQRPDLRNAGLNRLAKEVLGLVLVKPRWVNLSNWEADTLSHEQIAYACADAFLAFEIGKRLFDRQS